MSHRVAALLIAVVTSMTPCVTAAQTPTRPPPVASADEAVAAVTYRAAEVLGREVAVIDALGGFAATDQAADDMLNEISPVLDPDPDRDLVEQLISLEAAKADARRAVLDADLTLSTIVLSALEPLSEADLTRAADGQILTGINARTYLHAIHHLVSWQGAAPADPGAIRPPDSAARLAEFAETGEATEQRPGVETAEPAPNATLLPLPPRGGIVTGDDASVTQYVVLGGALAMIVALGTLLLVGRRRRDRTGDSELTDLVDIGRRLTAASTAHDVERRVVREMLALVDADAGAFIRCLGNECAVAYQSSSGLVRADELASSALRRAVTDGQAFRAVLRDPAFDDERSVLAIPIEADPIRGAIVAVRRPDRPFDDADVLMATRLRPLFESALGTATAHDEMRTAVLTDPLTGVANRRALDQRLTAEPGVIATVMVDVDHFKLVNDLHGHAAGDDVLRAVAVTIEMSVAGFGDVYRYGGEEFAVVIATDDLSWATEVAEQIRLDIAALSIPSNGHEHRVTASFGLACGRVDDDVLRLADAALYEAKRQGRDRVIVAPASSAFAI